MYGEMKTMEQYLCWLGDRSSNSWKRLRELDDKGLKDSPDYRAWLSEYAAFDAAYCLFQELLHNIWNKDEES